MIRSRLNARRRWKSSRQASTPLLWRNVFLGERCTLAEQEILHVLHDDFLRFSVRRIEAVLVENHLAVLAPLSPRLFGDTLVNTLTQRAIEGWFIEPRQVSPQLHAIDHPWHS